MLSPDFHKKIRVLFLLQNSHRHTFAEGTRRAIRCSYLANIFAEFYYGDTYYIIDCETSHICLKMHTLQFMKLEAK